MPRRMTTYFRAKLKEKAEEGESPNAIQVWASGMGCLMTLSTLKYHISGQNHPRTAQRMPEDKRLLTLIDELMLEDEKHTSLQVQNLLSSRHGIKTGLPAVQRAVALLGWHGSSPFMYERMLYSRHLNETKTFDYLLFTNEISVSLEHSNKLSFRETGFYSSTQSANPTITLHVWAGISTKGPGPLAVYEESVSSISFNEVIVCDTLVPWMKTLCLKDSKEMFVVIDHDPKHLRKAAFMECRGIRWMRAPPEPFLVNPIKMIWPQLNGWLNHVHKPVNKAQLEEGIQKFWFDVLTQEDCVMTIGHLHKVVPAVFELQDGVTNM